MWSGVLTVAISNVLAVLFQHFAVVGEAFRRLEPFGVPLALQGALVDVTDGNRVAERGCVGGVTASLAADAEAGDIELAVAERC